MPNQVDIDLQWERLDWLPDETWKRDTLPNLLDLGFRPGALRRCVYVIRLNGNFAIDYPWGQSPVLYVGEGKFGQRIISHREWVSELRELVGDFAFQVRIAIPRVRKNANAYLDAEAAVLIRFRELYGSAPLWNKQMEKRRHPHYVYNRKSIDDAIGLGSGKRYKWALQPMKASPFYEDYVRTHAE